MALVGVVVLSPDSLMICLAGMDDYTLIFYRGLFPAIAISAVQLVYVAIIGFILVPFAFILLLRVVRFVHSTICGECEMLEAESPGPAGD